MDINKKSISPPDSIPLITPRSESIPKAKTSGFSWSALCLGLGLALSSLSAQATNWQYLGGSTGYNQATGQPNNMTDKSSVLPSNLFATVLNRLPEGQPIGNNPTALAQLTNDEGANIFLKAPANIKVSYVNEGAGYQNSVGFFKFNTADLTTLKLSNVTDTIMFPNFSDPVLQFGNTVDLGNFNANDAIGFTIIANGWLPYTAAKPALYDRRGRLKTQATQASGGIVDPNKDVSKIFRTIKRFNPESTSNNLQAHTILFAYPEKELIVLAFEDLNRQSASFNDYGYASDNDFNDVVIAMHVTPFSAVDCTNCNLLIPPPTLTCKTPITTTPIPAGALTNNGAKANICHFTSSVTNPYEIINISVNALQTHFDHHDDVFQIGGVCPPVSSETCPTTGPGSTPTPPVCVAPQVLDTATNTCKTPVVVCTAPQVLDTATNTCKTPPVVCTAPQVLDAATNTCKTPVVVCTAPEVLDQSTNTCKTPPPTVCSAPLVLNPITNACESCTAPKVFNPATNACETCPAPKVYNAETNSCETCPDPKVFNSETKSCEVCPEPKVFNSETKSCEVCPEPTVFNTDTKSCSECTKPKAFDPVTKSCEIPPPVNCLSPFVRNPITNTCIMTLRGEDGPISWREITAPPDVIDTEANAKAEAKAARDAAAKAAQDAANGANGANGAQP